ncbi:hypothetical protein OsI_22337 [Oryza sativa Indica Group]|uniref:Uncharacterized protein n=1 Tax=Oryza sativa subsp. indica TaxID=39946 RepID=A2YB59_ORYSI|nr:hypothetical protein OsI_22337 [Oryza sativa Indica Group]
MPVVPRSGYPQCCTWVQCGLARVADGGAREGSRCTVHTDLSFGGDMEEVVVIPAASRGCCAQPSASPAVRDGSCGGAWPSATLDAGVVLPAAAGFPNPSVSFPFPSLLPSVGTIHSSAFPPPSWHHWLPFPLW